MDVSDAPDQELGQGHPLPKGRESLPINSARVILHQAAGLYWRIRLKFACVPWCPARGTIYKVEATASRTEEQTGSPKNGELARDASRMRCAATTDDPIHDVR